MLTPQQTGAALYATARTIQAQGRNGDTLLAHITPEEAQLLDAITDGASIVPLPQAMLQAPTPAPPAPRKRWVVATALPPSVPTSPHHRLRRNKMNPQPAALARFSRRTTIPALRQAFLRPNKRKKSANRRRSMPRKESARYGEYSSTGVRMTFLYLTRLRKITLRPMRLGPLKTLYDRKIPAPCKKILQNMLEKRLPKEL